MDGSPDSFPEAMESWLREAGATDESQLQDAIVQHMFALFTGSMSECLAAQLQETHSWNDKVDVTVQALRKKLEISMQYTRDLIEAAYARINQARQYKFKQRRTLRSQVIVMRSSAYPYDSNLSRYFEKKPDVYEFSGNNVLKDPRCANIINRHLDQQTISLFNEKNLCNSYMINENLYAY